MKNIRKIAFVGLLITSLIPIASLSPYAWGQGKPKGEVVFGEDNTPKIDYTKVVAVVNGFKITEGQLEARLEELTPQQRERFDKSPSGRADLIDRMVNEVLFAQQAEKLGLDKDPLVSGELDISHRQVLLRALSDKEIKDVKVSVEDEKKWYGEHLADLMRPESVHVKHILLRNEADAKKVMALLKKKDSKFEKIAAENSLDPGSKNLGGDLNYIVRGQTVPEFEAAAFNTPVGKLSDIVKTQFGYHILLIVDKKAAGPIPFEDIQDQLKDRLKFDLYLKPLKDNAKIEIVGAPAVSEPGPGLTPPTK